MDTNFKVNNQNAVIYARYSSDAQTEQSIEGQVRVINEYAQRNNIPIIDSYIDRAISGRREDRPDFQRMIAEAKQRKFGYVLVYKYDRFSRDRLNSLVYKRELKKYGVKVISVTEYISDDPQGILFESIIDGYSEYYSAELAQKVRRGNRESRLKGLYTGGYILYGYEVIDKKYVIKKDDAEVVKKIFTDVANGITYPAICSELNSQGIRHNGKDFQPQFIHKTVRNTKYFGKMVVNDELFTNVFPPIIDEELYNMANKRAINNQGKAGHFRPNVGYLLSGKAYCGCCGAKLVGESGSSKAGKVSYYYKCNTRKKKLGECSSKTIRKEVLENIIVENIKEAIIQSNALEEIAFNLCQAFNETVTEDPMISLNENAIKKNRSEIDNIMKAIKAGFFNDTVKETLDKLEEEKKQLELEQLRLSARTKNKIEIEDALSFLYNLIELKSDSPDYQKILIDRFVRKVILYDNKVEVFLYPIDNQALFDLKNPTGGNNSNNQDNSSNNGDPQINNNEGGDSCSDIRTTSPLVRH